MTTRLARALAGLVAAAALSVAALPSPAVAAPMPAPSDTGFGEARIIWLMNQERAMRGLQPLANNGGAHNVALYSTNVQAWNGRLAHNQNLPDDMTRNVSRTWWAIGENIGCAADADSLHGLWMQSSGHRANILNPSFDTVGVGVVYARGCLWATVDFADI